MTRTHPLFFADTKFHDASNHDEEGGEICIPNISPKEREKRAQFAIRIFVFSLSLLAALVILDVQPLWRLPLFFLFSAATTSYFQSLDKT